MASGAGGARHSIDFEELIEAVRSFPCLWEVSSKGYKDSRARDNGVEKCCRASWRDPRGMHQKMEECTR